MGIKKIFCNCIDLIHLLLKSKYNLKSHLPSVSEGRTVRILGNGKSLNDISFTDQSVDYMVVNRHVLADNYYTIKPRYYVLADSHFFKHEEGISVLNKILEKTDWELFLFVPYSRSVQNLLKNRLTNDNVKIRFYNLSSYSQEALFSNFLYSHQLAMPVVQNVIVACIMLCINMHYNKIELYGVEHNWLHNIFVGDDNIVYQKNPHFYDKQEVEAKPLKDIQHTDEYPYYLILSQYSRMFESYWEIKKFVMDLDWDISIVNKTKGSFIDAFSRV